MPSPLAGHWDLEPGLDFLNHGSFGATPRVVLAAQADLRARMERQPVQLLARDLEGLLDGVRAHLADFVHADAAGLALVPNATSAINAAFRSIALQPGDEILVTDHTYNACKVLLDHLAAGAGATVGVARLPFRAATGDRLREAVLAAAGPRTRVALIDHITSATALTLPVAEITQELRASGVVVVVDGAHGPGAVPVDISAIDADFYIGNCHKWMCAPKGAAFLHVAERHRETVLPHIISHGLTAERDDRSRVQRLFDWMGTDDPTSVLAIPAALEALPRLAERSWEAIREHNRSLALQGRAIVAAAIGDDDLPDADLIGPMASVRLPGTPDLVRPGGPDRLNDVLLTRHRIEVPVFAWGDPPTRMLRLSAHLYNSQDQYERLADALGTELGDA